MKKIIDLVGSKSLLILYLKMHLKDNQKMKQNNNLKLKHKIHNHNHNLKFNNNINRHNNNLHKILHKINPNKYLKIRMLKNNNKFLCINNKYNKFSLKLNHYNNYNNKYQINNKRQ